MSSDAIRKENPLRGARILIVGRDYFFYTREITDELRSSFGAEVAFHPIEPPSYAYRLLKKTGFPLNWWLRRHHERVIAGTRDKAPQIVLFIQVHQIGNMVAKYREAFGSARFVLYYWDSLKTHDYRAFVRYFDKVFTFDRADATQMPGLNYLPLFFPDSFRRLREERDVIYDMSFVGVAVTVKRYDQLVKLRSWAKSSGISLFDYIVVSPALFVRRLLHGQLLHGVHFRSLCERDLMRIYGSSRAVLDLPNNVQSGYTMRTFESLGAHRKLITQNRNIIDEDFYTPESVFVIGLHGEMPDRSFFDSRSRFAPAVERYDLRSWILRLLSPAPLMSTIQSRPVNQSSERVE